MEVRPARLEDLGAYAAFARAAQARLIACGLGQYVPAAHDEYAAAIRTRVELGLYAVWDGEPALYLAGTVVGRRWCLAEADRRGCRLVRLDCHAANEWLCRYYESHGFVLPGRVEQHPGYVGCLYQREVPPFPTFS